jgi:hypothetical protein
MCQRKKLDQKHERKGQNYKTKKKTKGKILHETGFVIFLDMTSKEQTTKEKTDKNGKCYVYFITTPPSRTPKQ